MNTEIILPDLAATLKLGRALAQLAKPGDVIFLKGDLGAGKSTLARAFIQALTSEDEEVPSPTFTLVQTYEGETGPIFHFDLYRLEKPSEAYELGIEDAFMDGICLIEWPERLGGLAPRSRLEISLLNDPDNKDARKAQLTQLPRWDGKWDRI